MPLWLAPQCPQLLALAESDSHTQHVLITRVTTGSTSQGGWSTNEGRRGVKESLGPAGTGQEHGFVQRAVGATEEF